MDHRSLCEPRNIAIHISFWNEASRDAYSSATYRYHKRLLVAGKNGLYSSLNHLKSIDKIMSPVREQYNPVITQLLREHDQLGHDQVEERKSFQRRILFLMNTIKSSEFEESFN